jgi:preprotein translocase subunit SecF
MSLKERLIRFYDKNYKKLFIIPILMLVLGIAQISFQTATTGDFIHKGVSLKGGSTITILQETDALALQNSLDELFPERDITVRGITRGGAVVGVSIESDAQEEVDIDLLSGMLKEKFSLTSDDLTIEVTGSSIGNSFFRQTVIAIIIAFALMALVVLLYFRTFIPSVAVVLAALSDIIVTLAIINLLGVKLSTAGVAAFLMLIGYSVDTDILLTSRLIKRREGTLFERLLGAIKTGMTMTLTTLVAVLVAFFVTNSDVIRQIMLVLLIGLIVDIINTWIQNAAIIRWYMERKHGRD